VCSCCTINLMSLSDSSGTLSQALKASMKAERISLPGTVVRAQQHPFVIGRPRGRLRRLELVQQLRIIGREHARQVAVGSREEKVITGVLRMQDMLYRNAIGLMAHHEAGDTGLPPRW
jgi:hypothetical protein